MHLTRPKSSKGRSRAAANGSLCAGGAGSIQRPPASPDSAAYGGPARNLGGQSQAAAWQASQLGQEEVLQVLQHAPAAPPQSLNKYKVLPSIERRPSEVSPGGSHTSKLSRSHDATPQHRQEEPDLPTVASGPAVDERADVQLRVWPKPPDRGPVTTKEAGATGSLLLAIRAPCGRRFQQHFDPTDTLLTVRASAEVRYGATYGDASIETVDVPRRTFTDMNRTLAQCGVLNRSLLCIARQDSVVAHE